MEAAYCYTAFLVHKKTEKDSIIFKKGNFSLETKKKKKEWTFFDFRLDFFRENSVLQSKDVNSYYISWNNVPTQKPHYD